jgi:hypothetical protein
LNGKNAMRETEASSWMVRNSRALTRGLPLAAVALGLGLVTTAGAARAGDDEVDQRSFSERFVDSFKSTIRGTTMDNRGIDYRERSPLVVPPNLDLPPPAAASNAPPPIANWPKDPDERQRKAIIAAKKKNAPPAAALPPVVVTDAGPRPVNIAPPIPEPPAPGLVRPAHANDQNGTARTDPIYDQPGDLFKGGASTVSSSLDNIGLGSLGLGNLFGSKKEEPTLAPGTEPTREALTQPPSGYQTPSPNFPYAVQSKGFLSGESNPDRNPAAQSSSASSVVH